MSLLVSIPHSGTKIPPEALWLKKISPSILSCDVDYFIDDLYYPALHQFQIPFIYFKWHRYSVDVNRFSTNISPLTVQIPKQNKKKCSDSTSPSDIHWHKTTKGHLLITKPLTHNLHKILIKKYFLSFHQKVKKQIRDFRNKGHKSIYLLDLHSMPSKGLKFHKDKGQNRKQIIISNNNGKTSSKSFTDLVVTAYQKAGFKVGVNWPYMGGALVKTYGKTKLKQQGLQIELNRKLYMNEKTKQKNSTYSIISKKLTKAVAYIVKHKDTL